MYKSGRLGFRKRDSGDYRDVLRPLAVSSRGAMVKCLTSPGFSALQRCCLLPPRESGGGRVHGTCSALGTLTLVRYTLQCLLSFSGIKPSHVVSAV